MTEPSPTGRVMPLSRRQRDVLRVIVRFYEVTGEPPSVEYVGRRLGIHHSVAQAHIDALFRKGWLTTPTAAGVRCLHSP